MSERGVVLVAVAAFAGALCPTPVPLPWVLAGAVLAVVSRSPGRSLAVVLVVAVLCSSLAHRSWTGIHADRTGAVDGVATVVRDPERTGGGTSAVVRLDGTRYLTSAWGAAGAGLARVTAGDLVHIIGRARPYDGRPERKAAMHVGTALAATSVSPQGPGHPLWRAANALRGRLVEGAASLDDQRRALFTGLVYGDDRGQDPVTASDFRLAGLTHLLAVSGQNVAYALTLARPLIQRLSLAGRWFATVAVLVLFATMTRFEPSVLRATTMAGLAVTARMSGREASSGRLLALAVTVLLVIDPLLAETVAFRLSVAASAGIVWLQPLVQPTRLRPLWLRDTVGVTLAAQLAVAPLLITTFGPVSLVSLPANVLAGPIAGVTMMWGMTAGLAAGFLPARGAAGLHQVTSILLLSLETIAATAGAVPIAPVGLAWIGGAILWCLLRAVASESRTLRVAPVALAGVLLVPLASRPVPGRHDVGRDGQVWVDDGRAVLVVEEAGPPGWLLDDLRALHVRRIDVAVVMPGAEAVTEALARRIQVASVRVVGTEGVEVALGDRRLSIEPHGDDLVTVLSRPWAASGD